MQATFHLIRLHYFVDDNTLNITFKSVKVASLSIFFYISLFVICMCLQVQYLHCDKSSSAKCLLFEVL